MIPDAPVGKQFGPYLIQGEISRGGQGVVMRALDSLGRPCALKMLTSRDPSAQRRFQQEGRVLATLSHPNLLRVTDLGERNGIAFLAMEFVDGMDLEQRVAAEGIPAFAWTARTLISVAHALHHCHQSGLVHRDLKPANVLIEAGSERPVLVDFGLVKRDPERMRITSLDGLMLSRSGEINGTPKFMAPEQAAPQKFGAVSPRTDVYSLGATLFFALTGKPPFDGVTLVNIIARVIGEPPPDPRSINSAIPPPLAKLCLRCLAKDPGARPESIEEVAKELARITGQEAWLPTFVRTPDAVAHSTPLGERDPRTLGPYQLTAALGRGGMGAVFLGQHKVLGVVRAIKVMDKLEGYKQRKRFQREINHLARVRHPNLVSIHDSGDEGAWAWYAMDPVTGGSLERLAEQGPLPWRRAVKICLGVAEGVGALHAVGVIHRDLKPANIVLHADGRPIVLDLGLAVAPELDERLTKTGALLGTPYYLAPEQARGQAPTPAVDVHAVGLLLFELLTGQRAVDAATIHVAIAMIMHQPMPLPSTITPTVPARLDEICARALEKDPARRYQDGRALARDLAALLEEGAELGRRRGSLLSVAAVVLVAAALGLVYLRSDGTQPLPSEPKPAQAGGAPPEVGLSPKVGLTEEEVHAGERDLRKVEREKEPRRILAVAEAWLAKHTAAHPAADRVETILRAVRLRIPVYTIKDTNHLEPLEGARFVAWADHDPECVVRLFDATQVGELASVRVPWLVDAATHGGGQVFLSGGDNSQIRCFAASGLTFSGALETGRRVSRMALSPSGKVLAVARAPRKIEPLQVDLVSVEDGRVLRSQMIGRMRQVRDVAWSPSGAYLVVVGGLLFRHEQEEGTSGTNGVFVLGGEDLTILYTDLLNRRPNFVTFAASGSRFAVGTNNGEAMVYDAEARERVLELHHDDKGSRLYGFAGLRTAMGAGIRGGALSPDGSLLYMASGDYDTNKGALTVWDAKTGERVRAVEDQRAFTGLELTSDGEWLLTSQFPRGVAIWRAR